MEGQRQKAGGGRKRRHKAPRNVGAPVLIVARRPDAPFTSRAGARSVAASAEPARAQKELEADRKPAKPKAGLAPVPRRAARIIQTLSTEVDEQEKLRQRLLQRLVSSEGRLAISNAANELWSHQFEAPHKQEMQIQLLEHFDEARARDALDTLAALLEREPPIKRPILEQRLRRMEEHAEEQATRDAAGALRRAIRS